MGTQQCWAKFRVNQQVSLCVPHQLWIRYLNGDDSLCGEFKGKVKTWSPPENSIHFRNKHFLKRFEVTQFPKTGKVFQLFRLLERVREEYSVLLSPHDPYGVFRKLILNQNAPGSPIGMIQKLGFVHLLTSAGIHLYALAHWNGFICFQFFRRLQISASSALALTRIVTFLLWVWVWLLNGLRPGMLRPWLLVSFQTASSYLGFRWKLWTPLFLAIAMDIALGGVLSQQGRWFYILAVGGGILSRGSKQHFHFHLSVSSWIFAALWEAWEVGLVALATPFLSLISIPIFALITFPGILTALQFSSNLLLHWITAFSDYFIYFCLKGVFFLRTLWVVPYWSVPIGLLMASFVFVSNSKHRKPITAAFILVCFGIRLTHFATNLKIEQLDVGQGDSALIQTSEAGLIDTGSKRALSDDAWIAIFSSRNIDHLSWLALTHLDEDHAGATTRLSRLLPIDCISTSLRELKEERGIRLAQQVHLTSWEAHCVPHFIYRPAFHKSKKRNRNMSAVLVSLPRGGFYLSAGDADSNDEFKIAEWVSRLPIQKSGERILKISHHGSRFSTTPGFLKKIDPTQAWISAGRGNSYGHPTAHTLNLLKRFQIQTRRTDENGSISYE